MEGMEGEEADGEVWIPHKPLELRSVDAGECQDVQSGRWLLLPVVSVGNVPQLAMDLLVNTLGAEPIAHIRDPQMLPVCGDGSPQMAMTTGCELFDIPPQGYVSLPRAPPSPGRAQEAALSMFDFCSERQLGPIYLLMSAYAGGRRDAQLQNQSPFRYMVTSAAAASNHQRLQSLGILPLEGCGEKGWPEDLTSVESSVIEGTSHAPAFISALRRRSFVRTLLTKCETAGMSLTVLLMFVFEGDNTADADSMATMAARVTEIIPTDSDSYQWKIPSTWMKSHGPPPTQMLY